jgi:tRNA G18 (ribose-2'-O)-methylase SpoU
MCRAAPPAVAGSATLAAMEPIGVEAADDPRLGEYVKLNDQRFRRRLEGDGFFIAEGYVAIDRLIESEHRVRSVLLAPSRVERFAQHLPALAAAGVPVFVADADVIAGVVGFDLHRGVLASADRLAAPELSDLAARVRRVAMLEGLNDPENLGAIARAAAAFSVDGLVIDRSCTDPYSRRTVRVSMGEVLSMPVVRVDGLPGALAALHEAGFESWAMTPDPSADDLWARAVPDRVAVVLGAEGPGLRPATVGAASRRVRIPIASNVDSLNVGHAAAVAFAALARPV